MPIPLTFEKFKKYRGKTEMTQSQHDTMLAMTDMPTHNIKSNTLKKILDTIYHTKEQDAKISAKRLKKNKKKQAKKNKNKKK
jgi:hypothetical protein